MFQHLFSSESAFVYVARALGVADFIDPALRQQILHPLLDGVDADALQHHVQLP